MFRNKQHHEHTLGILLPSEKAVLVGFGGYEDLLRRSVEPKGNLEETTPLRSVVHAATCYLTLSKQSDSGVDTLGLQLHLVKR